MRLLSIILALVFFGDITHATDSLRAQAPSDWQGIKFGLEKKEAIRQIKAKFTDVSVADPYVTAKATINGQKVPVTFIVGDSEGLYLVRYITSAISYSEAIAALTDKFGQPSSSSVSALYGYPVSKWTWSKPYFEVMLSEMGGQIWVNYDSVDPEAKKRSEEESEQRKIDEAKKSSNDF